MIETKIKVIVIEDESLSRTRILRLLKDDTRVNVIASYESFNEVKDKSFLASAQILMLDINLPGMNGIDIAKLANKNQIVIFTTAYSKFAVDAFNVKAMHYLVKPISQDRLKDAITRAANFLEMNNFYQRNKAATFLKIKHAGNLIKINQEDIMCVRSDNNHVIIYTYDKEYLLKQSLTQTARQLDQDCFIQCHRTCIVNIDKIIKIVPFGSTKNAILENKIEVPLSRKFLRSHKRLIPIDL